MNSNKNNGRCSLSCSDTINEQENFAKFVFSLCHYLDFEFSVFDVIILSLALQSTGHWFLNYLLHLNLSHYVKSSNIFVA
jgi:hypothetical protein